MGNIWIVIFSHLNYPFVGYAGKHEGASPNFNIPTPSLCNGVFGPKYTNEGIYGAAKCAAHSLPGPDGSVW